MAPPAPRLGVHLPLGSGLLRAADRAGAIGAQAIQVFADNPAAWQRRAAPPNHLEEFRARLGAFDIRPVAIHASYLVNLAGPDPTFRASSIRVLASDLRAAPGYGARFVNVHTGSHRGTTAAEGIARVADGVAEVLAEVDGAAEGAAEGAMLVLENAAGGGWTLGATVEEQAEIANAAAARGIRPDRLGFCLDTAHAWGAGIRMDDPDGVDDLLDRFDRLIGLDRLVMVHLNDSRSERGSRQDRHEHIGGGLIGVAGLHHLMAHPAMAGLPMLLEVPMDDGYDAINLRRAEAVLAGAPLDPLPLEAFEISSRANRSAAPS
jgi:deoxyribonuclease-4